MTQNFSTANSSGSSSGTSNYSGSDRRESSDNPEEIRADINQTRQAVGEKIDQLQARLDPNRLKQQAQETVQEMISDTAQSMTEYVRSHRDEMVGSLADAARRNPLPTALVGLGVGWLILESFAGKRHDSDQWRGERRNLSPRGGWYPLQDNIGPGSPDYRNQYDNSYPVGYPGTEGTNYRGSYRPANSGEFYDADSSQAQSRASSYPTSSNYQGRSEYQGGYQGQQGYSNGQDQHQNPIAKAAGAVKETVSEVGHEIKERIEDAGQGIKERVEDVRERISDVREHIGDNMSDLRGQAGQMRNQGQQQWQRAGYQMEEWQQRARYEGQRRGQQVMRNLEDNPLTYGALALAAGAAIAILLPQTRTENRYFGEMRDQIMERGQEALEVAKDRAQEVVSEVRPELEEKARQIVSDAKELGKEVVKDAAEELRPVVDKAVSKGKEEARNAAQEIGVNPDKLMSGSSSGNASSGSTAGSGAAAMASGQSNTPVLNRDTLRGQWKQVKGEVKSKWGQLTDDDLTRAEGDYEKLLGSIQTRYGYTRGRAEQELNDFFNSRKV